MLFHNINFYFLKDLYFLDFLNYNPQFAFLYFGNWRLYNVYFIIYALSTYTEKWFLSYFSYCTQNTPANKIISLDYSSVYELSVAAIHPSSYKFSIFVYAEVYSEPCQTSQKERFSKIVKGF